MSDARRFVSVLCLCAFAASLPAVHAAQRFERVLTLEKQIPVGGTIELENLIGRVRFVGGVEHRTATIEARIVAEAKTRDEARSMAEAVALESRDADGASIVHVAFPVDRYAAFRVPKSEREGLMGKWLVPLVDRDTVALRYDDRVVEIGNGKGAAQLSVDLELTPPMDVHTKIMQMVGSIEGRASRGSMQLEVVEGQVAADHLFGELHVRAGGGEVQVTSFHGEELALQTRSGDLRLSQLTVSRARLTTGSGRIIASEVDVDELAVQTSTGDVEIAGLLPRALSIESSSGEIDLAPDFRQTREASIRSGSGDVTLRVGELASFDLVARTRTGEIKTGSISIEPQQAEERGRRYRCGAGGPSIHVEADQVMVRGR